MKIKVWVVSACLGLVVIATAAFFFSPETENPQTPIKNGEQQVIGEGQEHVTIATGQHNSEYTSKAFKSDFRFNAIAPHWKEMNAAGNGRTIEVRTSEDNKNWAAWTEIEAVGALKENDPHPDRTFTETPLFVFGNYFQVRIKLSRNNVNSPAPVLSDMLVTYLDSTQPTPKSGNNIFSNIFSSKVGAAVHPGPGVVSRAQWGSPDPYGKSMTGDQFWPAEYVPVKQIFVHHTVNANNSSDFPSIVRGIWHFHALTRGWGDIGYNYLVDGNGTVYEGRFGGDNVVGGHALHFNRGSMGIGLIGCFQSGSSCSSLNGSNSSPSAALMNRLSDVIAWKATAYEIDPNVQQTFCDISGEDCRLLWTVSGHRDVNETSCPGDIVYDQLGSLREAAALKKSQALWPYVAKQQDYNQVDLVEGERDVTLSFKNTGSSTWTKSGFGRIILQTANPPNHSPSLVGGDWINANTPSDLDQTAVLPGETGTFTFKVNGSGLRNQTHNENFRLVSESNSELQSYFGYYFKGPRYAYDIVSQTSSTGSFVLAQNATTQVTLKVRNTGNLTWSNSTNPVRLATWAPSYRTSTFNDGSWVNQYRAATLQENSVAPGAVGTFTFNIKAPSTNGFYVERFNLVAEGAAWFDDPWLEFDIQVGSYYKWQMVSQSSNKGFLLRPDEPAQFSVVVKNTGNLTWSNSTNPVRLATWAPSYRTSLFHDGSWSSQYRAATLQESSVNPGQNGTFTFNVKAPSQPGFYAERFNLVMEGAAWFDDPWFEFDVHVGEFYNWIPLSQASSTGSFVFNKGDTAQLTLSVRNTGNMTWSNAINPVRLATWNPSYRTSTFNDGSWVNQYRAATLQENSVAPGAIGTFVFNVKAPSASGFYVERFNLVAEGAAWFRDPWLEFDMVIQ